ncbi:Predicted kinase [Friedmanniella luteola]|uniref:Predicted kinase n=1 Tax=Friedmanniella luteola TaxID=546871 RepID=A0A1H1S6J3_9ACTN|nr:ATP-binding protein [Friedmanniella luteola]SDS43617.1 Predicted kinase [Friedmanniella luteola]
MLIATAGLPGAGKSSVADALARRTGWPVLSVDPVEAALLRAGVGADQPTGLAAYLAVEAVAEHQLRLGQTVLVDAVNAAPEARAQWEDLALRTGTTVAFVEVICSDPELHRQRLESRRRDLGEFPEPHWDSLGQRREQLAGWTGPRLVVDTVGDVDDLADALVTELTGRS